MVTQLQAEERRSCRGLVVKGFRFSSFVVLLYNFLFHDQDLRSPSVADCDLFQSTSTNKVSFKVLELADWYFLLCLMLRRHKCVSLLMLRSVLHLLAGYTTTSMVLQSQEHCCYILSSDAVFCCLPRSKDEYESMDDVADHESSYEA
ncbi:hypothetical protein NE237_011678 [Protea cynaroides]|uniref:Uncharacterized protein n=1 Tax=Protea cynaroides TaxID=273540 RepID=A0A9Q0GYN6_9MAGN|nr:hypothetical protein NE237_011678 [Protea cynaroides]